MRHSRVRSWVAAENLEVEAPETVEKVDGEVPAETVESTIVEIDKVDRDIESLIDDGDQIEQDITDLEELSSVAEDSVEEGGMDESAARIAEVAAEAYCSKWGVKRQKIATENFGLHNRLDSTRLAVESLDVAAEGLADTFVNWAKEMKDKIGKKWSELMTFAGKFKTRVARLREKFNAAGELATGDIMVKEDLLINGKVDVAKMGKNVANLGAGLTKSANEVKKIYDNYGNFLVAGMNKDGEETFTAASQRITDSLANMFAMPFSESNKVSDWSRFFSGGMPNNAKNAHAYDVGSNYVFAFYTVDDIPKFAYSTNTNSNEKEWKTAIPNKSQLDGIIKNLETFAGSIENGLKAAMQAGGAETLAKLEEAFAAAKEGKSAAKSAEYENKADKKEAVSAANKAVKQARAAVTVQEQATFATQRVIQRQAMALATFVEGCLKTA